MIVVFACVVGCRVAVAQERNLERPAIALLDDNDCFHVLPAGGEVAA